MAEFWGCSEPTVKRLLGPEELPLSRLLSLLDFLGLSLKELYVLMEMEAISEPKWTAKQNEFLSKHPKLFAFTMKLYEPGATPASIAKKYRIPALEVERILIQLEKYDVIRVGPKGEVRPYHSRLPGLEGPLGAVHSNRWLDSLNQYLKANVGESLARQMRGLEHDKGRITTSISDISEKTYNEYREKFERLERDFESAAKIDEGLPKAELKTCVKVIALFTNRERTRELAQLEDVFADELVSSPD